MRAYLAVSIATAVLAILACGEDRPPISDFGGPVPVPTTIGPIVTVDAGDPACTVVKDEAGVVDAGGEPCGCFEFPFLGDVPNIYFVLDRSGSMGDGNKWTTVRKVVSEMIGRIGVRATFGAAVFPDAKSTNTCQAGVEVMSLRRGDNPPKLDGPVAKQFLSLTPTGVGGATPTAATLRALEPKLDGLAGTTYVVLATDGGPNCNPKADCGPELCMPNIENDPAQCVPNAEPNCCAAQNGGDPRSCLDTSGLLSAVASLKSKGVATFVLGIPGSGPYASLLNQVATAGGTARAGGATLYYRVDGTDSGALEAALRAIAAQITGNCLLRLSTPPVDPTLLNVYLDEVALPADPNEGWVLEGGNIEIKGAACKRIQSGEVLGVRVTGGCPTIRPN